MSYVDGFVIPLPKKNLEAYRRMAKKASRIWRQNGALEVRECIGDGERMRARNFPGPAVQR